MQFSIQPFRAGEIGRIGVTLGLRSDWAASVILCRDEELFVEFRHDLFPFECFNSFFFRMSEAQPLETPNVRFDFPGVSSCSPHSGVWVECRPSAADYGAASAGP